MANTRAGEQTSAQISVMGSIKDLQNKDFSLEDGQPFNIKNEGAVPITLEVQLSGMNEGDFVETLFSSGWNPEIVKVVKQTSSPTTTTTTNLKWGY